MHHLSKRYRAAVAAPGYDRQKRYPLPDAVKLLLSLPKAKFDETVELCVRLGIDPKKTEQMVRGSVSLPRGLGKKRVIAVFAEGDQAQAATAAGADFVGGEDLAKKIVEGFTAFDVCIAHPSMMRHVGKLGKLLGPQGKMPSPKSGTVSENVADAVREFKAGKVEFRTDQGGNVHVPVGKRSFSPGDLESNIHHFIEHLRGLKPGAVKGTYLRKVSLSSTMSPAVRVDVV